MTQNCCLPSCASYAAWSTDLPLNISREMLQNNPHVTQMRKALTGRVISELEHLADNEPEAFGKVWDAFGVIIKRVFMKIASGETHCSPLGALRRPLATPVRLKVTLPISSRTRPKSTILSGIAPSGSSRIRSLKRRERVASRSYC